MAPMTLDKILDVRDNFDLVRDQIGSLIVENIVTQKAFAVTTYGDDTSWRLDAYLERSQPWTLLKASADPAPIANITAQTANYREDEGSLKDVANEAVYHVDLFVSKASQDDGGTGQLVGDEQAARQLHFTAMLVRNILMSEQNFKLQLPGIVFRRHVDTLTIIRPGDEELSVLENVIVGQMTVHVKMIETSPEETPEIIEAVNVKVFRDTDGRLLAEAEYDLTPP